MKTFILSIESVQFCVRCCSSHGGLLNYNYLLHLSQYKFEAGIYFCLDSTAILHWFRFWFAAFCPSSLFGSQTSQLSVNLKR